MEIDDIIVVLSVYPTSFKLLILVGLSLIIVGVVPSLIIRILKIPAITLTRNQSIMLVAIGCILILSGMFVLASLTNVSPTIDGMHISPGSPLQVSANGTLVNITVHAHLEKNIIQRIFNVPTGDLYYTFYLLNPKGALHRMGPTRENHSTFILFPSDAGESIIMIDVSGYGVNSSRFQFDYTIVLPQNQPPNIDYITINNIGSRILISVEAEDPENDRLYYWFAIRPPRSESFYEIPPIGGHYYERERIWAPNASYIGDNIISIKVSDGDDNGPWMDRAVQKNLTLNIYDPDKPSWRLP